MNVVAFDLETTSLTAMIGRVLCCSFKPITKVKSEVYTFRGDDKKFRNHDVINDSKLVAAIRDELVKYDILVGHNSKLFDRKFLNGRLFKWGLMPLPSMFHIDTMWAIRTHIAMSSKLDNVQKHLNLEEAKSPITWDNWARAGCFDRKAMDEVVNHCE